jgi:hypothetical protein
LGGPFYSGALLACRVPGDRWACLPESRHARACHRLPVSSGLFRRHRGPARDRAASAAHSPMASSLTPSPPSRRAYACPFRPVCPEATPAATMIMVFSQPISCRIITKTEILRDHAATRARAPHTRPHTAHTATTHTLVNGIGLHRVKSRDQSAGRGARGLRSDGAGAACPWGWRGAGHAYCSLGSRESAELAGRGCFVARSRPVGSPREATRCSRAPPWWSRDGVGVVSW